MRITKNNLQDIFRSEVKGQKVLESQGYELVENLFCDNSGLGTEDEPALTVNGTIKELERVVNEYGTVYTYIRNVGQFQVNVGVYTKTGKKTSKKIANNTYLIEKDGKREIILHDTVILSEDSEGVTLNTGGYYTNTTKERLNRYLKGVLIFQRNFNWFVRDLKDTSGNVLEFEDGMTLKGETLNV